MIENFELNEKLFFWINSFAGKNEILDWIFVFIAEYLIYILLILFLIYFGKQIWRDRKIEIKEFIIFFGASFGAWIITKILKIFIHAERPFSHFNLTDTLEIHKAVFNSFPSGHSTFAFALATSVWIYNKKIGTSLLFLAFLVALGRPLVGVHYPLDILVGAFIGVFIVLTIGRYLKGRCGK